MILWETQARLFGAAGYAHWEAATRSGRGSHTPRGDRTVGLSVTALMGAACLWPVGGWAHRSCRVPVCRQCRAGPRLRHALDGLCAVQELCYTC